MTDSIIPSDIDTHDNTMMSAYAYCPRLYAITHVERRKRMGSKPALSYGGLAHIGMNIYYTNLPKLATERTDTHVIAAAELALKAMQEADFEEPIDDYRTRERCMDDFIRYVKHYGQDRDLTNILFTETAHDVAFPDGFKWGGIVDLWAEYHYENWLLDHKTTVISTDGYFDEYRRAPQMLGYELTGAALSGTWPAGVIINRWIVQKTSTRFDRKPITFPDWLVAECRDMQVINYREIADRRARHTSPASVWDQTIWKANLYNCVGKYGRCSMYDICHSHPENREFVLENETEESVWDWREVRE